MAFGMPAGSWLLARWVAAPGVGGEDACFIALTHCTSRRFARVWAVIGRMAHSYLVRQGNNFAGWRPKNWGRDTLSCGKLLVRGAVSPSGQIAADRSLSADAEAQRMQMERPWGGTPVAAWLHQCPYARDPIVCCGKRVPCWETVCSMKETANFELMRGFVHAAHAGRERI